VKFCILNISDFVSTERLIAENSVKSRSQLLRLAIYFSWIGGFVSAFPLPTATAQETAAASESADSVEKYDIWAFKVKGNTVLSTAEVEDAVYPFSGPKRTLDDIQKAREALQALYLAKGFQTVSVVFPAQVNPNTNGGIVQLDVTELTVGKVTVTGARYFLPDDVRKVAASVEAGKVPNFNDLQKDLVKLSQLPDRNVIPELLTGQKPNTIDVNLKVEDKLPLHGTVELNNRNSAKTSDLRVLATASYDNLWQLGHSISLFGQIAPQRPNDAKIISGSYLYRLANSAATITATGQYNDSEVAAVAGSNVVGRGYTVGLRASVPLPPGNKFSHTFEFGSDYKFNLEELKILVPATPTATPATPDAPLPIDPCTGTSDNRPVRLRYVPFNAGYQAFWYGDRSQTSASTNIVFGFRGLGSNTACFQRKRFGSSPGFFYVRTDFSRSQLIGKNFQFFGKLSGQLSRDPLVSGEQFSIGGLNSVRGYYESEALGDLGASVQTELRAVALERYLGKYVDSARVYVFGDFGITYIHEALPEQKESDYFGSVGLGLRFNVLKHLNGSVDLAWPLVDGSDTLGGTATPVAKFRIWSEF
jgi:hemolysin activation/secretion protein